MSSRLTAEVVSGFWTRIDELHASDERKTSNHATLPKSRSSNFESLTTPGVYGIVKLSNRAELRRNPNEAVTDLELVAKEYERLGSEIFQRLRGTFCFAVVSKQKSELALCRDKIGVVPLYFVCRNGTIYWCSLIAPLIRLLANGTLNIDYLMDHLSGAPAAPYETPFKSIWQLPPGCFLTYNGASCNVKRFWTLEEQPKLDLKEALEQFERVFHETLERLTKPFAPTTIGLRLSGGYDSTSVALGLERIGIPVRAFHLKFPALGSDETAYIMWLRQERPWEVHVVSTDSVSAEDFSGRIVPYFQTIPFDPYERETSALHSFARALGSEVLATGAFGDEFCLPFQALNDAEFLLGTRYLRRRHGFEKPSEFLSCDAKKRWADAVLRHWSPPIAQGVDCMEVFLGWNACFQIDALYEASAITGMPMFHPFLDECMWNFALRLPNEAKTGSGRFKPLLAAYLRKYGLDVIANRGNKANLSSYFLKFHASAAKRAILSPESLDALADLGLIDYNSVIDFVRRTENCTDPDIANELLRLWQIVDLAKRLA